MVHAEGGVLNMLPELCQTKQAEHNAGRTTQAEQAGWVEQAFRPACEHLCYEGFSP